jgi:hypothetical protein
MHFTMRMHKHHPFFVDNHRAQVLKRTYNFNALKLVQIIYSLQLESQSVRVTAKYIKVLGGVVKGNGNDDGGGGMMKK